MAPPPTVDKHAIAAFRRFFTLLPRTKDPALVILKIHLLVEEQIRAYLDERVESSASLKRADLSCHQAIWLAESLCTDDIHQNIWEAARKLNELRNKIAHTGIIGYLTKQSEIEEALTFFNTFAVVLAEVVEEELSKSI